MLNCRFPTSLVLWMELLHNYKFSILHKFYYLFISIYVNARVTKKYIYKSLNSAFLRTQATHKERNNKLSYTWRSKNVQFELCNTILFIMNYKKRIIIWRVHFNSKKYILCSFNISCSIKEKLRRSGSTLKLIKFATLHQ